MLVPVPRRQVTEDPGFGTASLSFSWNNRAYFFSNSVNGVSVPMNTGRGRGSSAAGENEAAGTVDLGTSASPILIVVVRRCGSTEALAE